MPGSVEEHAEPARGDLAVQGIPAAQPRPDAGASGRDRPWMQSG